MSTKYVNVFCFRRYGLSSGTYNIQSELTNINDRVFPFSDDYHPRYLKKASISTDVTRHFIILRASAPKLRYFIDQLFHELWEVGAQALREQSFEIYKTIRELQACEGTGDIVTWKITRILYPYNMTSQVLWDPD